MDPFGTSAELSNSDAWHMLLDLSGMIPAGGAIFDFVNGVWYVYTGDWSNAAWNTFALIPLVGDISKAPKVIKDSSRIEEAVDVITDAEKINADGLPISNKITGWTKHGAEQAIGRDAGKGVSNEAILDAVNNPTQIVKQSGGTEKYIGRDATVVLNQNGKVVTTWANGGAGIRGGK